MKRLALSTLATALGVGMVFTVPDAAAAQRESPLPVASRMHPDSSAALLQEPPGGKYKKVSTLVALPGFVPGSEHSMSIPRRSPPGRFSRMTTKATW